MALSDSIEAIGAVSGLLQTQLMAATKVTVDIGRPESAAGDSGRKLNLFLYRIGFDASLRNHPLDPGQDAPLWLVLYYLVTAFDGKESDSIPAHKLLGKGLAALQGLNFMHPQATDTALAKNPESLKVTFDEADVELLSKIMQGTDEKYRVSAAFQVRPVMIVPDSLPAYAPLVKSVGPLNQGPEVMPSLGARLDAATPERFEAGATLTFEGSDLAGYDQAVVGPATFPIVVTPAGAFTTVVPVATTLSAGAYPIALSRTLASGHSLTSNAVLGHLLPKVSTVTVGPLTAQPGTPPQPLSGSFTISGRRLGGPGDSIFAALFRDGAARLLLELTGSAAQTSLTATVTDKQALPPGDYYLVLRVNGEQAIDSPLVSWV
jgi:uncharacterized protein DUF4255